MSGRTHLHVLVHRGAYLRRRLARELANSLHILHVVCPTLAAVAEPARDVLFHLRGRRLGSCTGATLLGGQLEVVEVIRIVVVASETEVGVGVRVRVFANVVGINAVRELERGEAPRELGAFVFKRSHLSAEAGHLLRGIGGADEVRIRSTFRRTFLVPERVFAAGQVQFAVFLGGDQGPHAELSFRIEMIQKGVAHGATLRVRDGAVRPEPLPRP